MKSKSYFSLLAILSSFLIGETKAATYGQNAFINYTWMDAIVNNTPVESGACPSIDTDIYGSGFRVALQKSFVLSLGVNGSRWFPKLSQWASVGVAPVKNSFGIFYSDVNKLNQLSKQKEKKIPNSFEEINNWKVSDSAYWESQGGVSFYLGTGIFPIDLGSFVVATGGWANFLQKTGPNKVYVEMSRKNIRSVSLGLGALGPTVSIDKAFENSHGFSYEFTLDDQQNIEAFERFMAGDVTKAQELSKFKDSGILKISDLSGSRIGLSKSFGLSTPYIPILSFKTSSERAFDSMEENSIWDEKVMKDTGIYIKQKNFLAFGQQVKESRSFLGGRVLVENSAIDDQKNNSEKLFGNFKYSYQSNWGQEHRLRNYLKKIQRLTGLVKETCARVPSFEDSLGFNQISLDLSLSDSYIRSIIGQDKLNSNLLKNIKLMALKYENQDRLDGYKASECLDDNNSIDCSNEKHEQVDNVFKKLEKYSNKMNKTFVNDRKEFTRNLALFGEQVWKSPYVFKAFYEKGKHCGQGFRFEVSGKRITKLLVDKKFENSSACLSNI